MTFFKIIDKVLVSNLSKEEASVQFNINQLQNNKISNIIDQYEI